MVLPTSAAQDIVRAFLLSRRCDYAVSWSSTWIARIMGFVCWLFLSLFGLLYLKKDILPSGFYISVISALCVVGALVIASFSHRVMRFISGFLRKVLPEKRATAPARILESISAYRTKKSTIAAAIVVTLFTQLILITGSALLILGISGKWFFLECLAFIPLIELLCMSIPLTPSGVGIREALTIVMFRYLALSTEELGAYIVFQLFSVVLKIVGIIPVVGDLFHGKRSHTENDIDAQSALDATNRKDLANR
jgi:uncharacterized protein (TIRG00374 family)